MASRRFTPGKIVIHTPQNYVNGVPDGHFGFAHFWRGDTSSQIRDLFSGDNLMTLHCTSPSDYTPMSVGQEASIKDGVYSTRVFVETKRLGFKMKVRDMREDLRIAFEELMSLTVREACQEVTPILIDDYCYLRTKEDRIRGYRPRVGIFTKSLTGLRGNIVQGKQTSCVDLCHGNVNEPQYTNTYDRFGAGFEFEFMELQRKAYY